MTLNRPQSLKKFHLRCLSYHRLRKRRIRKHVSYLRHFNLQIFSSRPKNSYLIQYMSIDSSRSFFTRLFTFRCTSRPKPPKPLHQSLSPTPSLTPTTAQTTPSRRSSRPTPPPKTPQGYSYRSNRHRKSSSRASTSSSVSGIYASITQKQDTLTEISTIKRPSSMYDLQQNRWMRETTEASDVSR